MSELFSENLIKGRSLPQHINSQLSLTLGFAALVSIINTNCIWSASCYFTYSILPDRCQTTPTFSSIGASALVQSSIQNYLCSASCYFTYRPNRPLPFRDHISTHLVHRVSALVRPSIQNHLWSASCHLPHSSYQTVAIL